MFPGTVKFGTSVKCQIALEMVYNFNDISRNMIWLAGLYVEGCRTRVGWGSRCWVMWATSDRTYTYEPALRS